MSDVDFEDAFDGDFPDDEFPDDEFPDDDGDGFLDDGFATTGASDTLSDAAYAIMTKEDVYDRDMISEATRLATIFMMDPLEALHLLCRLDWVTSKFTECEDTEKMRVDCGLPREAGAPVIGSTPADTGMDCVLCWETDLTKDDVFLLSCNHVVCRECWQQNITVHLNEYRPASIVCPVTHCSMAVFGEMVEELHPTEYTRYKRIHSEVFIRSSKFHSYCNNPRCEYVIKMLDLFGNPQVTCKCSSVVCFRCTKLNQTEKGEGHYPCSCNQFIKWLKSTSTGMIDFRQKPCPNSKCKAPIIKCGCPPNNVICDDKEYCPKQCCNHMTCPSCKYHFCWICLKPWSGHDDYYKCKFVMPEKQKNRTFLDEHLEAYLKYKDYSGNYQGFLDGREWAIKAFDMLRETEKITLTDNFLLHACEELAMCYHTLRNSYVVWYYQYHCSDNDAPRDGRDLTVTFFEHLQENLESYTNQLSCFYEKEVKVELDQKQDLVLDKVQKLIDLTQTIRDYRMKLFAPEEEDI